MRVKYRDIPLRHGFLLIELICALALLSVVSLVIAHALTTILFLQHDALRRFTALSVAHNHIESWVAHGTCIGASQFTQEFTQESIALSKDTSIKLTCEKVPTTIIGFEMVKVVATWQSPYGRTESTELYAGVARAVKK
ncbi:MAG: prepilin-type N-terminal cleavage/methylation domain-containing protein [Candidatus Dependentiae bacterium]|nr:prepilin-type N-terminal cleavage/methylation domain-containing protein [Candidatus Dependentiae bacterium]